MVLRLGYKVIFLSYLLGRPVILLAKNPAIHYYLNTERKDRDLTTN